MRKARASGNDKRKMCFFFGFGVVWMGRLESEEAADSGLGEFAEHGVGVLAGGQKSDGNGFAEFFAEVWVSGDSCKGFG